MYQQCNRRKIVWLDIEACAQSAVAVFAPNCCTCAAEVYNQLNSQFDWLRASHLNWPLQLDWLNLTTITWCRKREKLQWRKDNWRWSKVNRKRKLKNLSTIFGILSECESTVMLFYLGSLLIGLRSGGTIRVRSSLGCLAVARSSALPLTGIHVAFGHHLLLGFVPFLRVAFDLNWY